MSETIIRSPQSGPEWTEFFDDPEPLVRLNEAVDGFLSSAETRKAAYLRKTVSHPDVEAGEEIELMEVAPLSDEQFNKAFSGLFGKDDARALTLSAPERFLSLQSLDGEFIQAVDATSELYDWALAELEESVDYMVNEGFGLSEAKFRKSSDGVCILSVDNCTGITSADGAPLSTETIRITYTDKSVPGYVFAGLWIDAKNSRVAAWQVNADSAGLTLTKHPVESAKLDQITALLSGSTE